MYSTRIPSLQSDAAPSFGGITLHTLRHTCATNLIRAGVRESIVAALLGDTVRTVVETYVNLNAHDLAAGVSRGPAFEI